jgi:hypothetical protein
MSYQRYGEQAAPVSGYSGASGAGEAPSQPSKAKETWKCFKCRRSNASNERICSCGAGIGTEQARHGDAQLKQEESTKPVDNRVWVCEKTGCGYAFNFMDTDMCSKCGTSKPQLDASLQRSQPAQFGAPSAPQSQPNEGGFGGISRDQMSGPAAYSATDEQSDTFIVDICVNVMLTKEGWVCEMCQSKNDARLAYCFSCNKLNSIGQAVFQHLQARFGSS